MTNKKEELKKIQEETIEKNINAAPKKRGRGRPPKSESDKKAPKQEQAAAAPMGFSTGLKATFKTVFNFVGKSLAVSLSFKKFELENEESEMLAEQADQVMIEFAPHVGGKWAKLGIFLTSLLTIFGKKYFDFASEQEKTAAVEKMKKENENKKESEDITVSEKRENQTVTEFSGFSV